MAIATFVALAAVSSSVPVQAADVASDAATVKRQAVVIPSLKQAAASAAGYQSANIHVTSTAHQVTIKVVNGKLNGAVTTDRDAEAATIVSAIAKAIAGKPEFAQVVIIHVDYVKQAGNKATVVQGIDFNKAPDGAFALHKS